MIDKPIPNHVDDQMQVFFWEIDEFFPALVIFVILFMWDQLMLGIVSTVVFVKLFGRFKNSRMDGALFHMAWWAGLMSMNKRFDSGAMREVHE